VLSALHLADVQDVFDKYGTPVEGRAGSVSMSTECFAYYLKELGWKDEEIKDYLASLPLDLNGWHEGRVNLNLKTGWDWNIKCKS